MLRSHSQNGAKFITLKRSTFGHTSTELSSTKSQSPYTTSPPPWRPVSILDEYVQNEARPISLRQLTYFGRTLTEGRLLSSANYVRTELPTRLAHRIRDMQTLPYVVVTNPHLSDVYELYYKAFESLRRVREIKTLDDNEKYCEKLKQTLREHLPVIPKLAMGVLETRDLMNQEAMDRFMNTILRSRISRRVIAEQHIALTSTFTSLHPSANTNLPSSPSPEFVGSVFLKCNAKDVITHCAAKISTLARSAYGPDVPLPEVQIVGHLDATFPYILSHLEYIIGEMLRNSVQATVERQKQKRIREGHEGEQEGLPPIEVTICEAPQHVIIRISDQGGGIPQDVMPYLWSFSNGPRSQKRLENLHQVPAMAATLEEIEIPRESDNEIDDDDNYREGEESSSLVSLTSRPPNLRLGMGLPMSRVYAEYWAGSLQVHSLEGYGVDAFLSISKLGNRNEQVSGRASMDGV